MSGAELDREIERLERVIDMVERRESEVIRELRAMTADRDALVLERDQLLARVVDLFTEVRRLTVQPDEAGTVVPRSGWTSHGHQYGPTPLMHLKPRMTARCGGPGICLGCNVEATRAGWDASTGWGTS